MTNNVPESDCTFLPKEVMTPNKDFPGISKTVFTHICNLHSFLNDWARFRDKGIKLCRGISALKLHECTDYYYPHQLKPLTEGLLEALDELKNILEGIEILNNQLKALAKLQITGQPVIFTWSASVISDSVEKMFLSLQKEYRLKQIITENIAHCRDEKLIDVYISSWELEPYFESNPYLFAEVGLN
ncbi:cyclin-dependent kinase 2-interacting protein-like [Galleria mellonella]|uniref:Cyclin-dependent kinase 2-interacting protein-like n=1 Tax=Galleria mellonella TaxID=7137 RepID=A0A6J1X6J7_GALME|nr:cyclin-dependent kinase 2-interacting protein-like [Galleria mellonella]